MIIDGIGRERFLRDYWQRKPVLLRQALPGFVDPVSPEELAGLACESHIEARLVFTQGKKWELKSGPFKTRDFSALPDRNWTLLVQAVDQYVPGVRRLLRTVPFVPNWRVDDVMISYAVRNGGVGPHFDYYDVFLVQGQGSRIWKTGQHCTAADELRTDSGLKLLKRFDTRQEWELHSGDVLYVPPGVAHWGVSRDDSLCYSIGFRAPSASDMLLGFSDEVAAGLSPDLRFADPQRTQPLRTGEITANDLAQARRMLRQALQDDDALVRWFGSQMTQPRNPELIEPDSTRPTAASLLSLHPASRLAWQLEGRQVRVFVDGEHTVLPASSKLRNILQQLAGGAAVSYRELGATAAVRQWCRLQLQQGSLQLDMGDD